MNTFVVGDIHGGLKALIQVLNKLELKDKDTLIFVGDYVDGWSESAQVIQFLLQLSEKFNCVFIKGNHDVWCEDWLKSGYVDPTWYMHGGKETMDSYAPISKDEKQDHLTFFNKMALFHIDNENRLFVHAGFTSMHGVEKEVFTACFYFDRTLWEMALTMNSEIDEDSVLYPNRLKHYKEIYIGHTPTINYKCLEPMHAVNIWNVDTGAAFTGRLTAMNIDSKEFFQSDMLPTLYPNEKGRNKS